MKIQSTRPFHLFDLPPPLTVMKRHPVAISSLDQQLAVLAGASLRLLRPTFESRILRCDRALLLTNRCTNPDNYSMLLNLFMQLIFMVNFIVLHAIFNTSTNKIFFHSKIPSSHTNRTRDAKILTQSTILDALTVRKVTETRRSPSTSPGSSPCTNSNREGPVMK